MTTSNGNPRVMSSREGLQWLCDTLGVDARGIVRIELVADMSDDIMRYTVDGVALADTHIDHELPAAGKDRD